jgi:hypothetical protein
VLGPGEFFGEDLTAVAGFGYTATLQTSLWVVPVGALSPVGRDAVQRAGELRDVQRQQRTAATTVMRNTAAAAVRAVRPTKKGYLTVWAVGGSAG